MQLPSKFIAGGIVMQSSEFGGKRSKTRSGKIIRSSITGHRLSFEIETVEMNPNSDLPYLMSFIDEVGYNGVFTASLPIYSEPKGNVTGTPVVKAAVQAGSKTFTLKGASPNTENYTKPGDYITFSGHSKAYCIAAKMTGSEFNATQYNSNGNGEVVIYLTKPLLEPIAANEAIDFTPLFTLIPNKEQWETEITAANGTFTTLTLECEEFY